MPCSHTTTLPWLLLLEDGVNYATATAVPYVGSLAISSASTITFTAAAVDNTGATTLSNPLTVTVTGGSSGGGGGGGGSTWTLTVKGGIGTGTYPQYTWVNVTADAPPARQVFAGWTVTCSGQCPSLQFTDKASSQMQVYARSPGSATLTSTYKVGVAVAVLPRDGPRRGEAGGNSNRGWQMLPEGCMAAQHGLAPCGSGCTLFAAVLVDSLQTARCWYTL